MLNMLKKYLLSSVARDRDDILGNQGNVDLVADSLGLSANDLGMDPADDTLPDLDDGGDDDGGGEIGDDQSQRRGLEDRQPDQRGRQQQQQQQRDQRRQPDDLRVSHTRPQQLPRTAQVRPDQAGNLVDSQGNIVARAGGEARVYQRAFGEARSQYEQQVTQSRQQLEDLNGQFQQSIRIGEQLLQAYNEYKARDEAVSRLGIPPEEQLRAFNLYNSMKSDATGTIKTLIARAAARGVDVMKELGGQAGNTGVDPKVLIDLVREEIGKVTAPVKERTEQERRVAEQNERTQAAVQRTRQETQRFFQRNPDAVQYANVMSQMLRDPDPEIHGMSLGEMWARIQLNLRANSGNGSNQNSQQRRQMPNGRSSVMGNGGGSRGQDDMAPVSEDYGNIIDAVLADAFVR
jgi:hypothetical protein